MKRLNPPRNAIHAETRFTPKRDSAHRHELFGTRRVNGDGVVEITLGRTHAYGNREPLHHFVRAGADDVAADYSLFGTNADELHIAVRLSRGQRMVHRSEIRHVRPDGISILRTCLALAQSHGSYRRMRKDHRSDQVVVEAAVRLAIEQSVAQAAPGGDCNRSQRGTTRHVSDRIHPGHVGVLKRIGQDEIVAAQRDARVGQIQPGHVRGTSDRPEYRVETCKFPAVSRHQRLERGLLVNRGGDDVLVYGYALRAHFAHHCG
jgi:hypothetical protein